MKRILFLLILNSTIAKAQNSYISLPDSGAIWYYYHTISSPNVFYPESHNYTIKGDTVFNSLNYKKVLTLHQQPNFEFYSGAVRQDTLLKRAYFINRNENTERLIYDFDLSVGDTIEYFYNSGITNYNGSGNYFYVSNIDSVLIQNHLCKRFFFNDYFIWIEGIGSEKDLLDPFMEFEFLFGSLECFHHANNYYIPNSNDTLNCIPTYFPTWNSISENFNQETYSISPNPTSSIFQISNTQNIKNISIKNILGRKIFQTNSFNNSVVEIDASSYSAGLYFVELQSENTTITKKIVKQ